MHKSRLGCLVIDCPAEDVEKAAEFWSATLGGDVVMDDQKQYAEIRDQDLNAAARQSGAPP